MERLSETKNPKKNIKTKNNNFEFCKVCKLNHNKGRRHNFFPNHIKSLSSFLSRFQSKVSDVRIFIKNPSLIHSDVVSIKGFWCVFCDCDVTEHGTSFVWWAIYHGMYLTWNASIAITCVRPIKRNVADIYNNNI